MAIFLGAMQTDFLNNVEPLLTHLSTHNDENTAKMAGKLFNVEVCTRLVALERYSLSMLTFGVAYTLLLCNKQDGLDWQKFLISAQYIVVLVLLKWLEHIFGILISLMQARNQQFPEIIMSVINLLLNVLAFGFGTLGESIEINGFRFGFVGIAVAMWLTTYTVYTGYFGAARYVCRNDPALSQVFEYLFDPVLMELKHGSHVEVTNKDNGFYGRFGKIVDCRRLITTGNEYIVEIEDENLENPAHTFQHDELTVIDSGLLKVLPKPLLLPVKACTKMLKNRLQNVGCITNLQNAIWGCYWGALYGIKRFIKRKCCKVKGCCKDESDESKAPAAMSNGKMQKEMFENMAKKIQGNVAFNKINTCVSLLPLQVEGAFLAKRGDDWQNGWSLTLSVFNILLLIASALSAAQRYFVNQVYSAGKHNLVNENFQNQDQTETEISRKSSKKPFFRARKIERVSFWVGFGIMTVFSFWFVLGAESFAQWQLSVDDNINIDDLINSTSNVIDDDTDIDQLKSKLLAVQHVADASIPVAILFFIIGPFYPFFETFVKVYATTQFRHLFSDNGNLYRIKDVVNVVVSADDAKKIKCKIVRLPSKHNDKYLVEPKDKNKQAFEVSEQKMSFPLWTKFGTCSLRELEKKKINYN